MKTMPMPRSKRVEGASVLVGLLWCLALLAVVVIGSLHSARMDLQVSKNFGDTIQARYLALAGIEKAKALIYQDAKDRERSGRHHTGTLNNAPEHFRDVTLGRGVFSVIRQASQDETRGRLYGISDEESRLNINTAKAEELGKIQGMTPDVLAALMDWRDGDNTVTAGGAEADYYATRRPAGKPRNGPFETIQEMLMVRDVPRDLFIGEDANQNGLLDPSENDGASGVVDNRDGVLDAGWAGLLTTESGVSGLSASGQSRTDIRSADEASLSRVRGLSTEIAQAIVAYRGQGQFENLVDLLEVTARPPPGTSQPAPPPPNQSGAPAPGTAPGRPGGSPGGAPANPRPRQTGGPKLISQDVLIEIADELTATDEDEQAGVVNINTASSEVLQCLPGVSREMANAVVGQRKSAGFFPNVAALLKVDGFNPSILKQLWPRVTVRSETFRVIGEGRLSGSGARQRIEMIVRLNENRFETLSYREDL